MKSRTEKPTYRASALAVLLTLLMSQGAVAAPFARGSIAGKIFDKATQELLENVVKDCDVDPAAMV